MMYEKAPYARLSNRPSGPNRSADACDSGTLAVVMVFSFWCNCDKVVERTWCATATCPLCWLVTGILEVAPQTSQVEAGIRASTCAAPPRRAEYSCASHPPQE